MPELPEVETTVAGLRKVLDGETISRAEAYRADLRWPMPVDLRQRLTGARITGLSRRAKYGLIHTDRDDVLIFHLGMSGRWRVDPSGLEKHDHFVIETGGGRLVALNDPHAVSRVELFHQQTEIQPGRTATDADNVHEVNLDFNTSFVK